VDDAELSFPGEQNSHPKIVFKLWGYSVKTFTLRIYSNMINPTSGVGADAMDEIVGQ
jgi:hypothetical protein